MQPGHEYPRMDAHPGHAMPIRIQAIRHCDGFSGMLAKHNQHYKI